jgi:hypothetical protein
MSCAVSPRIDGGSPPMRRWSVTDSPAAARPPMPRAPWPVGDGDAGDLWAGRGRRASGVRRRASGVRRRASGVGRRASGVRRQASGVGRRALNSEPTSIRHCEARRAEAIGWPRQSSKFARLKVAPRRSGIAYGDSRMQDRGLTQRSSYSRVAHRATPVRRAATVSRG